MYRLGLIFALTAGLLFLLGMIFALRIGSAYTVDAFLIPKEQTATGQSSTLASASKLLGLSTSSQGSNFDKFQKYWASRDVAETLVTKNPGLMRQLFSTDWDKTNNRWYDRPHNLQQYVAVPLNMLFDVYPNYAPTAENLATYIRGAIKVDADPSGSEMHLSYAAPDAHFAQWFLRAVISQTDEAVRNAEQKRDQDFVNFSRDRLERETNVEYRAALTDSVRQFEISNIYAQAGDNFSFQYVETPGIPSNRSAPKPLTYTVRALLAAFLVAAAVVGAMLLWPTSRFARLIDGSFDRSFGQMRQLQSRRANRAPQA